MTRLSTHTLVPSLRGPGQKQFIPFTVFVRVVPDLGFGKRFEMIRDIEKKAEEAIDCLDKCIGKVYKVNGSIGEIARKERQEEVESPEYKKQRIARWEAQGKGMPPEYQTKKAKKVKK